MGACQHRRPLLFAHVSGRQAARVRRVCDARWLRRRPGWWQDLLRSGAPGRKAAASARNCLRTAADLERVDVLAAPCRMCAGEEFGAACEFPALAWLPDEVSKVGLLVRRLAVQITPERRSEIAWEAEVEAERDAAEFAAEEAEREAAEEEEEEMHV